jgi:type II secretory pathway pseudopilin PulG
MNLKRQTRVEWRVTRAAVSGFTLIEIALCLAIIGFALVAIIGVLPSGMDVQKNNREETVINNDAVVWADAIRHGARGFDDLVNYVVAITNTAVTYTVDFTANPPKVTPGASNYYVFTRDSSLANGSQLNPPYYLTNGARIVGLLSKPKYEWLSTNSSVFISNSVVATVRSLSGPAYDKAPQDNQTLLDSAFAYRMIVEIVPYIPYDPTQLNLTNIIGANPRPFMFGPYTNGLNATQLVARVNYVRTLETLAANSRDIRLRFRWPLLPSGDVGNSYQTFRLLAGGRAAEDVDAGQRVFFFDSLSYTNAP